MSLITYFIFFILYKIYSTQRIQFNTTCPPNHFYNSLNYNCSDCPAGRTSPYACYRKGISIYTFEQKPSLGTSCYNNDEVMIELDGNRKLLDEPKCIINNLSYIYTDIASRFSNSFEGGTIGTTIDNGNSIVYRYNGSELNYYRHACLDGYYERGCDYSANLCALSLYITSNRFCDIITDLDEKMLVNGNDIL